MSISETIVTAVAETCLPNACHACEREGLPILLLRKAMVPDFATVSGEPLNGVVPVRAKLGLRTLRRGYLYILLDRKHWQAYEVTPEGHLRRFNPYQLRGGEPHSLPTRCRHENHDIPSSLLALDTRKYNTAWLAFADDPWTSSVLDAYKDGRSPSRRFQTLDLKAARENPASVGIAMTHKRPEVGHKVFEYGESSSVGLESVHGFHSRLSRLYPLTRHLEKIEQTHDLQNGVLAFAMDDPVGLIQEANAQRLHWVERRQTWRENPEVAYPLLTSRCLLAIRASHRPRADYDTRNFEPTVANGGTVFIDPEVERQLVITQHTKAYDKRLEERYDEKKRAKFHAKYERIDARFQAEIDWYTADYVTACGYRKFADIERFDYDTNSERSRLDYTKTMTLCLSGGITDAPRAEDQPLGRSEQLWLKWLKDPSSPPYRALTLSDKNLLGGLLPTFSASEGTDWKDSVKLYAAVAALIGSKEGELWLRDPLRTSMAPLLGAVNAAASRLDLWLGIGVQRAITHLNVVGQSLHEGVHLIELNVRMTVGEYYSIQSKHVRQMQEAANDAIAKLRDRQLATKVRPIILGGVLSLAALDPKLASKLINISIWVPGGAEELYRSLKAGASEVAGYTKAGLSPIAVVGGGLSAHGRDLLNEVRINAGQAASLLHISLVGIRGAAMSGGVLLAMGSLFLLNDMLKKNMIAAQQAIGPKGTEALLALHGVQLGLLGGSIELVGKMLQKGGELVAGKAAGYAGVAAKAGLAISVGTGLIVRGAMISAAVGLFDATQAAFAAHRSSRAGDVDAQVLYAVSGVLALSGAYVGMKAAYSSVAFFGALGAAVLLGIAAYAVYKLAEDQESAPLERWARRCYFGYANETPSIHWSTSNFADIALAELNAATLGIGIQVGLHRIITSEGQVRSMGALVHETTLKFRMVLPQFDVDNAAYFWKLTVHRLRDIRKNEISGGEVIARAGANSGALNHEAFEASLGGSDKQLSTAPVQIDIPKVTLHEVETADGRFLKTALIGGSAVLLSGVSSNNIIAATLMLIYWPDREVSEAYAQTTLTEWC